MTVIGRLARYVSLWAQIHKIGSLNLESHSIEELVDAVFHFGGRFLEPIQIRSEIIGALHEIRELRPKYIVEVGTAGGGSMLLWSRVADPEATIVTIDLPGGAFGGGSSFLRVPVFRKLPLSTQTLHIFRGDSHDPGTLEFTKERLCGNRADFLFIDADHTEHGVRSDYRMYAPLVRKGGIVGFHDIAITNAEYGVRRLWAELKQQHRTKEFIGEPEAFGIGLMYV